MRGKLVGIEMGDIELKLGLGLGLGSGQGGVEVRKTLTQHAFACVHETPWGSQCGMLPICSQYGRCSQYIQVQFFFEEFLQLYTAMGVNIADLERSNPNHSPDPSSSPNPNSLQNCTCDRN